LDDVKGLVFNIQRYSLHDGPGIRTLIFLKGCPLRCLYCCNPESQLPSPEISFYHNLCQHCGLCVEACPQEAINPEGTLASVPKIDRQRCDACGRCAETCPSGALRVVGRQYSVQELMVEVLRDAVYYRRSEGGVTLSGGEPLAQPAFSRALLQACHERNIHTAIETCGYVDWRVLEEVLPFTDLFLYDLKHIDSKVHRRLTGAPNEQILENARRLADTGASIILRIPLVPGYSLADRHLRTVGELAASLNVLEVHLMPFHHLARDKYRRLERCDPLEGLPNLGSTAEGEHQIHRARDIIRQAGVKALVGG
jgi:pyruvate formate lyase activating enzyme